MALAFPSKKYPMLLLLLIVVGIAALVPRGLSQQQLIPGPLTLAGAVIGLPGSGACWSSLIQIEGCFVEIMEAVKIGEIGSPCCDAILLIQDSCWPQMFPIHPFWAPILKKICNGATLAPAPSLF